MAEGLGSSDIQAVIGVSDTDRARAFYEGKLGLRFIGDDGFGITFDANGIVLRASRVSEAVPVPYTALGWRVPDVTAKVRELRARGVVFERFGGEMEQDDLGVWHPHGGGSVAWFKDPDGNLLSLSGEA